MFMNLCELEWLVTQDINVDSSQIIYCITQVINCNLIIIIVPGLVLL